MVAITGQDMNATLSIQHKQFFECAATHRLVRRLDNDGAPNQVQQLLRFFFFFFFFFFLNGVFFFLVFFFLVFFFLVFFFFLNGVFFLNDLNDFFFFDFDFIISRTHV